MYAGAGRCILYEDQKRKKILQKFKKILIDLDHDDIS